MRVSSPAIVSSVASLQRPPARCSIVRVRDGLTCVERIEKLIGRESSEPRVTAVVGPLGTGAPWWFGIGATLFAANLIGFHALMIPSNPRIAVIWPANVILMAAFVATRPNTVARSGRRCPRGAAGHCVYHARTDRRDARGRRRKSRAAAGRRDVPPLLGSTADVVSLAVGDHRVRGLCGGGRTGDWLGRVGHRALDGAVPSPTSACTCASASSPTCSGR